MIEVLVLPRLLAIVITLPLLTFYSNAMGLLGGGVMCYFDLNITIPVFLHQLRDAVVGWTFWVGLIKAPVFAFIMALVGCHQGFQVERNASSVGRLTTQAVVESIFLVIVADAIFSILFSLARHMSDSTDGIPSSGYRGLVTRIGGRVLPRPHRPRRVWAARSWAWSAVPAPASPFFFGRSSDCNSRMQDASRCWGRTLRI